MKKGQVRRLQLLCGSLEKFAREYAGLFVCPTCLVGIPRERDVEITEAHIIPQNAGGSLSTLICRSCNSKFGQDRDKWFGEYLRLKQGNLPLLSTKYQTGRLEFDGMRVAGRLAQHPDGVIDVYMFDKHTHPEVVARLKAHQPGQSHDLTFQLPLLQKREMVRLGAFTAGYLLWFRAFGYSWVLQRHLENVRRFITDPQNHPLPSNYVALVRDRYFDQPFVGTGWIGRQLTLVAAIGNYLAIFPPAHNPTFYERLEQNLAGLTVADIRSLPGYKHHRFGDPLAVIFHGRLIVAPDVIRSQLVKGLFLIFPPDNSPSIVLTEEELRRHATFEPMAPDEPI